LPLGHISFTSLPHRPAGEATWPEAATGVGGFVEQVVVMPTGDPGGSGSTSTVEGAEKQQSNWSTGDDGWGSGVEPEPIPVARASMPIVGALGELRRGTWSRADGGRRARAPLGR
jgi:hypothetical protein